MKIILKIILMFSLLLFICILFSQEKKQKELNEPRSVPSSLITSAPIATPDIANIVVQKQDDDCFPFIYGIRWGSTKSYIYAALKQAKLDPEIGFSKQSICIRKTFDNVPYTSGGTFICPTTIEYWFAEDVLTSIMFEATLEGWQTQNSAIQYFSKHFTSNGNNKIPCVTYGHKSVYGEGYTKTIYYYIEADENY